jgi:hypothetical protein
MGIIELAQELNMPDFTVFVTWSGHIDRFSVQVHPGGWVEDVVCDVDNCGTFLSEAGAIDFIRNRHTAYRELEAANV